MIVLDTNLLPEAMKNPSAVSVISRLGSQTPESLHCTSNVLVEIVDAIALLPEGAVTKAWAKR